MGYEFDGVNKIIQLTSWTIELDVKDMYSRWKDWMQNGGAKYKPAFDVVGGNPIDESQGVYIPGYFFLNNGWRVRPQEADHSLRVFNGILVTVEGEDPFIKTQGNYNVMVRYSQPIRSEIIYMGEIKAGIGELEVQVAEAQYQVANVQESVDVQPSILSEQHGAGSWEKAIKFKEE